MLSLFDAVALVETNRNFRGERFEPAIYAKFDNGRLPLTELAVIRKIGVIHQCSQRTALVIYSTSYGAVQLMGFNIWGALLCQMHKADYCGNESLQRQLFDVFAAAHGIAFAPADIAADVTKAQLFALHFNGTGNVDDYAGRLTAAIVAGSKLA